MRMYKKMIAVLLVSALALIVVVGNGCDKKSVEPEKEQSIIGTWRMTTVTLKNTVIGDIVIPAAQFLKMSETGATTSTLQFNEDGTALLKTTYEAKAEEMVPGTWTKQGDKLTIVGAGIDNTVGYRVDGNTLTIIMVMPIDLNSDGITEDTVIEMLYTKL